MNDENGNFSKLKEAVERIAGKPMRTPRDFSFLANQIKELTGMSISESTLKRMWGYIDNRFNVSEYSLDVLARTAGYVSWFEFCHFMESEEQSSVRTVTRKLFVSSLQERELLVLQWRPDRRITLRYEGGNIFTVTEVMNSKLRVGCTCELCVIVDNEPLIMHNVDFGDGILGDYKCGMNGGVRWMVL